jgi:hypothetical protein
MPEHDTRYGPYLLPSMLPSTNNISFTETTFFTTGNTSLPSPSDVRLAAGPQTNIHRPVPVLFPSLNLIVKYGLTITIAEGQCLWAIRRFCPTVPVPEVYGWYQEGGEAFLYMQIVDGVTLQQGWPDLDVEEKYEICTQLRCIIDDLRELRQDPAAPFIGESYALFHLSKLLFKHVGAINQQPLQDVIFDGRQPGDVFSDVASFHDWFTTLTWRTVLESDETPHPWRSGLLDDIPIVFTHSDLHRSNIIMSWDENRAPRIAGIIDWHQSGWYPATWEFYKTRFTCKNHEQWETDFILEFLQAYRGYMSWDYFVLALGV